MATLLVYREGNSSIKSRIKAAVMDYYRNHRERLPAGIVINPSELVEARKAVDALKLHVPVAGNGGCLLPEVWLEIEEVKP